MIYLNLYKTAICLIGFIVIIYGNDFKGFDDTILYTIDWSNENALKDPLQESEPLIVTTSNKEKYKCMIPSLLTKENDSEQTIVGLGPLDLIVPHFSLTGCSYRIESYWTYEICHGNYIKQFHEEREGSSKRVKLQEYYLGKWDSKMTDILREKMEKADKENEKLRYKKIDGLNLPYVELEMGDGTLCDLNNEPRVTKVLYVCYVHGNNEIYSFKETSTCNYEVIILTQTLCLHPKYRPQGSTDNIINCLPFQNAPSKPRSLLAMEVESLKLNYQKVAESHKNIKKTVAVFKVDPKDGTMKMEIMQADGVDNEKLGNILKMDALVPKEPKIPVLTTNVKDTTPFDTFFQGKTCLTGGTGWWKYEFCYGRHVRQFHTDGNREVSFPLGYFDEKAHKEYLENNPHKRPKPKGSRTHIIHFYNGGAFCEKTGKNRQIEVKLKCLENSANPSTIALYLLEPQTCQYILGVESPLLCDILQKADDDGLLPKMTADEVEVSDDEGTTPADEVIVVNNVVEDIEIRFEND